MANIVDTSVIGFHKPDEPYGFLSNWYKSTFEYNAIKFTSMEQYMMYQKAVTFNDYSTAVRVLKASNEAEIKALGRQVKNYNNTIWNGVRQIIVYRGCLEKFKQNEDLAEKLLKTEDHVLAECAVGDIIWGIGLSMQDDRRLDMSQWKGQNLLGFTLMQVRDII